jgi:general secretion pathway protein A
MYYSHFGLTEAPFSIAPNPAYLFMTGRHQEALAHLYHGIESDAGFVLLTGDIGTGKTTVCRKFLYNQHTNIQVAFILNPCVDRVELLQAIAKELSISLHNEASNDHDSGSLHSVRWLTDQLHEHLLDNHARGINTVLLIDEAQQIHPPVLEFIRLLTNLETDRQKLLKIILVGQPELNDVLAKPSMSQLSQRITARYHIYPLTMAEVADYITYRLRIAGYTGSDTPFSSRRIKQLFAMTQGVPRLINVICDRALLGAYSCNEHTVSGKVLDNAFHEVQGNYIAQKRNDSSDQSAGKKSDKGYLTKLFRFPIALSLVSMFLVGLFWIVNTKNIVLPYWMSNLATEIPLFWLNDDVADKVNRQEGKVALQALLIDEEDGHKRMDKAVSFIYPVQEQNLNIIDNVGLLGIMPEDALSNVLLPNIAPEKTVSLSISLYSDPELALNILFEKNIPQLPATSQAKSNACDRLALLLWRCEIVADESLAAFKKYNRPAVVSVSYNGQKKHLVVLGIDEHRVTVVANSSSSSSVIDGVNNGDAKQKYQTTTLPIASLEEMWAGEFIFIWQAPLGFERFIYKTSRPILIQWLANAFAALDGQESLLAKQSYNRFLEQRIRFFQKKYQLKEDGKAGVETLLQLNELLGIAKVLEDDLFSDKFSPQVGR